MTLSRVFLGVVTSATILSLSIASADDTDPPSAQSDSTTTTQTTSAIRLPGFSQTETVEPATPAAIAPATPDEETTIAPEVIEPIEPVLPDVLASSAIAYGSYQTDVSNFKRDLESLDDIESAMNILGTHNSRQLASGWLAYSALLASQSEDFRKGVLDTEAYHGRDRLLNGMRNSPAYTLSLAGAKDAISRALGASKADARRLDTVGEEIKDQAYSLQGLGWAKARLSGKPADHAQLLRIAAIDGRPQSGAIRSLFVDQDVNKTISNANSLGSSTSLWDRLVSVGPELKLPGFSSYASPPSQYTIREDRQVTAGNIATLAALRIMGETDPTEASPYVQEALEDSQTQSCFEQAQLNLLQCVSASRNVFERPFCIGVHALKEVGSCVGDVSY
ncbi:MAG: hypothetical protein CMK07_13075 [Ponticaulis sp.]|nr:hypothetical protein [Ponticaulis sp.]